MGNYRQVDKGEIFVESGMTLITEVESDKYLEKAKKNRKITENENEISLFFDKKSYNLIGWQTTDIYQNSNTTVLSSIDKNINLTKNLFKLPKQD